MDKKSRLEEYLRLTDAGRDFLENAELPKHTNSLSITNVPDGIKPYVKVDVIPLNRIKQAIEQIIDEKDVAYADFERYKVECLGQDWEDAYDSLPQDDFRYGMERCLEILNELIAESEG